MSALSLIQNLVCNLIGLNPAACGSSGLLTAVQRRMKHLSIGEQADYHRQLLLDRAELDALIEEVVVPETWFFRDGAPFELLLQQTRSNWLPHNPQQTLRLLSVPCCSGEEPYSMAMALLDAGLAAERFHIDALDISPRSIARARLGLYGENSFRSRPLAFRDRHFVPEAGSYRIRDEIRRQVSFEQGNLLEPGFLSGAQPYDFIFCRNLLIYLDENAQRRALETLKRLLRPEGLLFVGYAEHGPVQACGFRLLPYPRASAFAYPDGIGMTKPTSPLPKADRARSRHKKSPPCQGGDLEGVRSKHLDGLSAPPPNLPLAKGEEPHSPKWDKREKTLACLSLDDIRRLADRGQTGEALRQCEHYLRHHASSAGGYYLLGLLLDASHQAEQAEQNLRKALYLQPDHHEALVHLAGLVRRQGHLQVAEQLLSRARRAELRARQVAEKSLPNPGFAR